MHLLLIFLFFTPIFCSTCNLSKLKYCEKKYYMKHEEIQEETQTASQKIHKRQIMCEAVAECGEAFKNCEESLKRRVEIASAGCPFLIRMYESDFVDCAIILEKQAEAKGCERMKPENSMIATYEKVFDDCVDEIVENECSLEQNRIYKLYRGIGINYLAKYMPLD